MRRTIEPTQDIARAVGQDAGNRNMRSNNRTSWNEDDWNAAVLAMMEIMPR